MSFSILVCEKNVHINVYHRKQEQANSEMKKALQMARAKPIEKKNRVTKLYSMNTRCWLEKCHNDKIFPQYTGIALVHSTHGNDRKHMSASL